MHVLLEVLSGPRAGERFTFPDHETFVIGRHPDCHCQLVDDEEVSRHHCLLEIAPPDGLLRDLDSTNGVYVNNQLYGSQAAGSPGHPGCAEVRLRDGDAFRVGASEFRFRVLAEAAPEPLDLPPSSSTRLMQRPVAQTVEDRDTTLVGPPAIAGYTMLRPIGAGRMGRIYLARAERDGTEVAIKILRPKRAINQEARVKFEREIAMTRQLDHPNIVRYIDHGFVDVHFYLVLEYVPGGSLETLLRTRDEPLSLEEARPILLGSAIGLAHAHQAGVIHRDLKPANILLARQASSYVPKLSDLGLAKNFESAGASGVTLTGDIGGSYGYMPSEQLLQYKYVGPTADVFSLGATFYTILTGRLVYDLKGFESPLALVLDGTIIPVEERGVDLPPALAAVINRAIARDPEARHPDARELARELGDALKR